MLPTNDVTSTLQAKMPSKMRTINLLRHNFKEGTERNSVKDAFSKHANTHIEKINALISKYNKDHHLLTLYQINELRKKLEDEHAQDIFIPQFTHEIENILFKDCQQQFSEFNISMHEQSLAEHHPTEPRSFSEPIEPFANFLANVPPDTGRMMLDILSAGKNYDALKFSQLFKNTNPEYNKIINDYEINYIGGSNSKNFIFTNRSTPEHSFVLRVDDRLGGAREMDTYLRNSSLVDIVSPIQAARSLTTLNMKTNTLLITPVCPGGTPEAHSKRCVTDNDRLSGALDIYSQMGTILSRIKEANILFPDAKNSNWLLDKQGKLVLSDTKALVFSDNGYHDYDTMYNKNQWIFGSEAQLVKTHDYSPREICDRRFNVDQMHSFILGKNLYQYLTQCSQDDLLRIRNEEKLDFSLPIFKTDEGRCLETLIRKMMAEDPSQRINVADAVNELKRIKLDPTVAAPVIDTKESHYFNLNAGTAFFTKILKSVSSYLHVSGDITKNIPVSSNKENPLETPERTSLKPVTPSLIQSIYQYFSKIVDSISTNKGNNIQPEAIKPHRFETSPRVFDETSKSKSAPFKWFKNRLADITTLMSLSSDPNFSTTKTGEAIQAAITRIENKIKEIPHDHLTPSVKRLENPNEFVIQHIDKTSGTHIAAHDITVTNDKVSALISPEADQTLMAKEMFAAFIEQNPNATHMTINGNINAFPVLQAELAKLEEAHFANRAEINETADPDADGTMFKK